MLLRHFHLIEKSIMALKLLDFNNYYFIEINRSLESP
jgi:hypothetical protein